MILGCFSGKSESKGLMYILSPRRTEQLEFFETSIVASLLPCGTGHISLPRRAEDDQQIHHLLNASSHSVQNVNHFINMFLAVWGVGPQCSLRLSVPTWQLLKLLHIFQKYCPEMFAPSFVQSVIVENAPYSLPGHLLSTTIWHRNLYLQNTWKLFLQILV